MGSHPVPSGAFGRNLGARGFDPYQPPPSTTGPVDPYLNAGDVLSMAFDDRASVYAGLANATKPSGLADERYACDPFGCR